MNLAPKQRFAGFVLAVVVVSGAVAWALVRAWTTLGEVEQLSEKFELDVGKDEKGLQQMQQQYAAIAAHVPAAIGELNAALLASVSHKDPAALANYQRLSADLTLWLRQQVASVTQGELILYTEPTVLRVNVKQLAQDISRVFREYSVTAQGLLVPATEPMTQTLNLKQFVAAQEKVQEILALANRALAQSQAIQLSEYSAKEPMRRMQQVLTDQIRRLHRRLVLASVASVTGLCVMFLVFIYRLWISPLHLRLRESDATIVRQAKLARKGQTASELAHEIRNPLAAINFRLGALQKELAGNANEHRDTVAIRKEVRRLNAILEDFLQLDQTPRPDFISLSAAAALREAKDLLAPQLAAQNIQVHLDVTGDTHLEADAHLLQQVLINLIKNAAESIAHAGTITLLARPDQIELRRQRTAVVIIEVQDTGPGIPPDVQEQLFDPFFTTKKGGTGLGLSIVERIVETHGGVLDFETKIGAGTKFRVVLPVVQSKS